MKGKQSGRDRHGGGVNFNPEGARERERERKLKPDCGSISGSTVMDAVPWKGAFVPGMHSDALFESG